ncbi:uncharacterized protein UV8b_04798 [Ustilaginoidea virens]|uniref:Uncharacterized protein n=1 Tax=Ustilaginoidea virens TaxID=1159556 RepID=A0A063BR45_USTVR|nr:uncharacterized protein UV8b_04798 [Ustilaginoidea virens]QUC20557.1 hypothetical protein UV8b_04798 [Ustilaginoidea virens]GAO15621.1 hypothetical protein UVI_02050530 [Ustilaginoidea virens]
MHSAVVLVAASVALYLVLHWRRRTPPGGGAPLPPGPKPLPVLGNVLSLPPRGAPEYAHWLQFRRYGPVSAITALGQVVVIIHGRDDARQILDKMSTRTSDRPRSAFVTMSGFDRFLPGSPYGDRWRRQRKMMHQYLGTGRLSRRFDGIQDKESRRLLFRVLTEPAGLFEHFKTEASAIILHMTYGYTIEPDSPDPLVKLIDRMMDNFTKTMVPLSWMVDVVPALKLVPGLAFKATARQFRAVNDLVSNAPYRFVRKQMAAGAHCPSFVSCLVEENTRSGDRTLDPTSEQDIKDAAGILYGGGADTTAGVLGAFALAMAMFPEVQRKAQREIDAVVGPDRLPGLQDQERLPYVSAVAKEALRWFPVAPVNTTHATTDDIHYKGYLIPKGAYLLVSLWWLTRDPETHPSPESFDPERYLAPRNEPDPADIVFGYGRRICPGRFLAEQSLFVTIARLLATFTLAGVQGEEQPRLEFTPGLVSHPVKFPLKVEPRSERHAQLVRAGADWSLDKSDAGALAAEADDIQRAL